MRLALALWERRMNKAVSMSIFLGTLSLQGCVSPYVQPEGPDVASLSIKNNAYTSVNVLGFKNAADCSGGKVSFVPTNMLPTPGQVTIKIKPDEPFSFLIVYNLVRGSHITYCQLPATFVPRARGRYTVYFSTTEDKCFMPMMVQTASGEERESSYKLRQFQKAFLETDSFCK
jgi:hypothetical protein